MTSLFPTSFYRSARVFSSAKKDLILPSIMCKFDFAPSEELVEGSRALFCRRDTEARHLHLVVALLPGHQHHVSMRSDLVDAHVVDIHDAIDRGYWLTPPVDDLVIGPTH